MKDVAMSAPTARVEAAYAALNGAAVSEEARACVKAFSSGLEYHEQTTTDRVNRRAEKTRDKLASVVGAFLMDLLEAAARPECVSACKFDPVRRGIGVQL